MAVLQFYLNGQTGLDSHTGLSLAQAIKTLGKLSTILGTVYDDFDFDNTYTSIQVNLVGIMSIASGGSVSDVILAPAGVLGDTLFSFAVNTWVIYGSHFSLAALGYQTNALVLPAGVTMEGVECDPFLADGSHVTAEGWRKTFLKHAADAATCQATNGTWFHGSNVLYVNAPFGVGGNIVARFRPSVDTRIFEIPGTGLHFVGPSNKSAGFLYPMYKSPTISPYAIFIGLNTSFHSDYLVQNLQFFGCWHPIGLIDSSTLSGTLLVSEVHTPDCVFHSQVVSDHDNTLAYTPIVIYSGNQTGTILLPVYLDITNWTHDRCTFNLNRPLYWDGTTVEPGAAAGNGNNAAQPVLSHGGNAYLLPRIFNPATSGRSATGNVVNIGDYSVIDPYFAQRDYQTRTDTPHTDSTWQSFIEDCTIKAWRAYSAGDAGTNYGMCQFSQGVQPRMRRVDWTLPDADVASGSGAWLGTSLASPAGLDVTMELEECKITFKGNHAATPKKVFTLGSAATANVTFRSRFSTIVNEGSSLTSDVGLFDVTGASAAATIVVRSSIMHSESATGFNVIDDATAGQLPLYGTSSTRLVMENNHYSNIASFDTVTATRDQAAEWRTGADGPHDSIASEAGGVRDALYTLAGTWNPIARAFAPSDPGRFNKIAASVTLTSAPTTGLNGVAFNRTRGADQFNKVGGGTTSLIINELIGA